MEDAHSQEEVNLDEGLDFALLKRFQLSFHGLINEEHARTFIKQLMLLDDLWRERGRPDVSGICYIHSAGGAMDEVLGLIDAIRFVSMPMMAIGAGYICSAAIWMLATFPKGRRMCWPSTRFMIHDSDIEAQGKKGNVRGYLKSIDEIDDELYLLLSRWTGTSVEKFKELSETDYWFDAKEAKALGIVDEVISF